MSYRPTYEDPSYDEDGVLDDIDWDYDEEFSPTELHIDYNLDDELSPHATINS